MSANVSARISALFKDAPFIAGLGIELLHVEPGAVSAHLVATQAHAQQLGTTHAGVLTTLADHAMAGAALTMQPADVDVVSVQIQVSLLRPAPLGPLRVEARVIKPGKTISFVEAEVFAPRGDAEVAVCRATSTMANTRRTAG